MARAVAALLAAALAAGAGCGERTFTASGLVDAANAEGARLALGERLTTSPEGAEVYVIRSAASPGAANPQLVGDGGKGTLLVADGSGSGADEFDRCEATADLTCFRAANVVLRFESLDAPDRARISGAISALASDG
ncbi:MAG: hypothetical protein EDQ89_05940 [Acidobacteria bacterium]|nr:MAG: hypothetical protein EDQ89_05940 [Acidobacteriota bacterium]GIK76983.1 MAG: hypothetical protein BroJett022_06730 [Actinomycetes bacterium]